MWSMSAFAFFYLLTPLLYKLIRRFEVAIVLLAVLLFCHDAIRASNAEHLHHRSLCSSVTRNGDWQFCVVDCIFAVAWLSKFVTQVDLFAVICYKQHDFVMMVQSMQVGSSINIPELDNGLRSIIANAPRAFATSLLRPSVFETGSATMMLAGVENLLILCVLAAGFFYIKPRNLTQPDVWYSLSFIVILFVLIGLTTPVLGALVRYKVPALPFIGILILTAASDERLQPIDKWLEKWLSGKK